MFNGIYFQVSINIIATFKTFNVQYSKEMSYHSFAAVGIQHRVDPVPVSIKRRFKLLIICLIHWFSSSNDMPISKNYTLYLLATKCNV